MIVSFRVIYIKVTKSYNLIMKRFSTFYQSKITIIYSWLLVYCHM